MSKTTEVKSVHLGVLLSESNKTKFDKIKKIADFLSLVDYPDERSKTSDSFFARWLIEIGFSMVLQTFDVYHKEQTVKA